MRQNDPARFSRELLMEFYRQRLHPERISRLTGMYCFLDRESADRAGGLWDNGRNHFRQECLAELHLGEADTKRDRLDSNWLTFADKNEAGFFTNIDWIPHYWAGDAYPGEAPIWETLVDGKMIVLGTELRQRAYANISRNLPNSLMFLELARLAAWVGSHLGNVCGHFGTDGDDFVLSYLMDMRDADNPQFLEKLRLMERDGHPVNFADMKPHIDRDSFGNAPDLRPFAFRRSKSEMPWLAGLA